MSALPDWVPDGASPCCMLCGTDFTLVLRRHHCRRCGRIVCHTCSPKKVGLEQKEQQEAASASSPASAASGGGKVRVCNDCFEILQSSSSSSSSSDLTLDDNNVVEQRNIIETPTNIVTNNNNANIVAKRAVPVATAVAVAQPVSVVAARAPPVAAAAVPVAVAASAPRLQPPTASAVAVAPVSSSTGSSGGFFSGFAKSLTSKVEKHAPALVAAVKEHVAAAATKHEEAQQEKNAHAERIIAQADAPLTAAAAAYVQASPAVASASSTPAASAAGANIAHIPGLGAIALAAPSGEQKQDAAWSQLASPPPMKSSSIPLDDIANRQLLLMDEHHHELAEPDLPFDSNESSSQLRQRRGSKMFSSSSSSSSSNSMVDDVSNVGNDAPSVHSHNHHGGVGSLKLNLPLRLCLVILKKTGSEMKSKYMEYLETKTRRDEGDDPLTFSQFMFFSTIRTLPEFLFKKCELSFCMMREEGDTLVYEDSFIRYAPILTPLASKLDASKIFKVLQMASLESGAALTQEQVEQENEEEELERQQHDEKHHHGSHPTHLDGHAHSALGGGNVRKRKAGGIAFLQFKTYVESLKKHCSSETNQWPEYKLFGSDFGMDRYEQLLCVRTGVTDTTSFPPRIGRLGLTTNFLLYESSFLKGKRCIRWSNIVRIEAKDESLWRKTLLNSERTTTTTSSSSSSSSTTSSTSTSSSSPLTSTSNDTTNSAAGGGGATSSGVDSNPTKGFKIYVIEEDHAGESSSSSSGSSNSSVNANSILGVRTKEVCLTMDIPGWGNSSMLERLRTFEMIRIMIHLHRLVATIPDKVVASALVQETCSTVLRMRALEAVGHGCNPLLLNPFPGYVIDETSTTTTGSKSKSNAMVSTSSSTDELGVLDNESDTNPGNSNSFVSSISASIQRSEMIRKSKSSWLFAILPGLQNKEQESLQDDIDPEVAATEMNYKTAEELLKLQRSLEQPFSLKNFAYNVKLFRYEIEPLMLFIGLMRRIRDWENPIVTLMTVMMLLNMAYRDLLMYLPAMLIFINIVIVAVLRYYPNAVWVALGGTTSDTEQANASSSSSDSNENRPDVSLVVSQSGVRPSTTGAAAAASPSSSSSSKKVTIPTAQPVSKKDKDGSSSSSSSTGSSSSSSSSEGGLFAKLKNYRDVAVKTKDYLHSVQNSIGEQNIRFMKVEGLYKWRSPFVTQKFFLLLCGAFLVFTFIPFRFIFPFLILDWFTTKWQRTSSFERLLDEVTLPQRMPEMD